MPWQATQLVVLALTSIASVFFGLYVEPQGLVPWSNQSAAWKEPFWNAHQREDEEEDKARVAETVEFLREFEEQQRAYAREVFRGWRRWVIEGETSSLPNINVSQYEVFIGNWKVLTIDTLPSAGLLQVSDLSATAIGESHDPVGDHKKVEDVAERPPICRECPLANLKKGSLLELARVFTSTIACRFERIQCWLTPAIESTGRLVTSWFLAVVIYLVVRILGYYTSFCAWVLNAGWFGRYTFTLVVVVAILLTLLICLKRRLRKLSNTLVTTQNALYDCQEYRKRTNARYVDTGTQLDDVDDARIDHARADGIEDGNLKREELERRLRRSEADRDELRKKNEELNAELRECRERVGALQRRLERREADLLNEAFTLGMIQVARELSRLANEFALATSEGAGIQNLEAANADLRQELAIITERAECLRVSLNTAESRSASANVIAKKTREIEILLEHVEDEQRTKKRIERDLAIERNSHQRTNRYKHDIENNLRTLQDDLNRQGVYGPEDIRLLRRELADVRRVNLELLPVDNLEVEESTRILELRCDEIRKELAETKQAFKESLASLETFGTVTEEPGSSRQSTASGVKDTEQDEVATSK